nr:thioredoxin family protein [Desulfobulbaceae bacterium]
MKQFFNTTLVLLLLFAFIGCSNADDSTFGKEVVPGIPVKNTVTLVDLGAKTCIPCKMMAPILEELKVEYQGRAEVIFIDVWEEANKSKAKAFKIMSIPTQVFFDKEGREVYRHRGFLDKEAIVTKLEELLAK